MVRLHSSSISRPRVTWYSPKCRIQLPQACILTCIFHVHPLLHYSIYALMVQSCVCTLDEVTLLGRQIHREMAICRL